MAAKATTNAMTSGMDDRFTGSMAGGPGGTGAGAGRAFGAVGGTGAAAAPPASGLPHFWQNLIPGAAVVPHFEQRGDEAGAATGAATAAVATGGVAATGVPHFRQNFTPAPTAAPHFVLTSGNVHACCCGDHGWVGASCPGDGWRTVADPWWPTALAEIGRGESGAH